MGQQGRTMRVVPDPCVAVGQLAAALTQGFSLAEALEAFVAAVGLRTAVLRSVSGELLGVGGEVLQAVPMMRALPDPSSPVELSVPGPGDTPVATLSVVGARPSQLPALRAAAAVLGLALVPPAGSDGLLDAAEADRDDVADALHDGPLQSLVVARYAADAAVRGGDPVVARDAVQQTLVEVRRALWHLRPRGAGGLTDALMQLSAQRVEAGDPALELEGDLEDAQLLRGARATVVYRLVQSVAGATEVTLRREGDLLAIELAGDLSSPDRWARRARALGGDLSASGGRLRLVLPFPSAHADPRTTP